MEDSSPEISKIYCDFVKNHVFDFEHNLLYEDDEAHWDEQFFNPSDTNIQAMLSTLPYQSCLGNHEDYDGGVLFRKYFPYPYEEIEEPDITYYWSFDYGPAHFVYVDQYQASYDSGSVQLEWIDTDLAGTDKKWKFMGIEFCPC